MYSIYNVNMQKKNSFLSHSFRTSRRFPFWTGKVIFTEGSVVSSLAPSAFSLISATATSSPSFGTVWVVGKVEPAAAAWRLM